ncbi:CdaR family transcriptional regulator [Actinomycetospora sp. TBRC 11914]|uniref:PucR family transcriptional regulator n=1 Tax=Actinomycetospora sp. TBRC 11914 TaxID=2729387 RepID=UPI00145F15CC|nr:helix-turn-helix domain-containing protein [Actinomycetospora sp. TBRC 11914]NMO90560.1 PucR family transcriptional regulator [Actinomycetospora sp. TBRC 11914]
MADGVRAEKAPPGCPVGVGRASLRAVGDPDTAPRRHPWADVPAEAADRMRSVVLDTGDDIIEQVRGEVAEYALSMDGVFGQNIRQGVSVALEQFLQLLGTDDDLPDTRVYFELGRVEHRHGRTMDALQSAYRVGSRVMWRRISAGSDAYGLGPDGIFRLAEALFEYTEQLAAASVAGYAHEQSLTAGSRHARRHTLVAAFLRTPPPEGPELERLAREAEWALPRSLAVVVCDEDATQAVCRRLPADVLGSRVDGLGVLVVPDPDGPGRADALLEATAGVTAVVGPTVPVDQVARTVERARAAWPLVTSGDIRPEPDDDRPRDARPASGLVRADDHLLALLLHADVSVTADLVAQRLEPLRRMTASARDRAVTTLRAWLDAHGDIAETAGRLHVHPQTVRYRLARLKESFAGALDDPVARLEVSLALRFGAAFADPAVEG